MHSSRFVAALAGAVAFGAAAGGAQAQTSPPVMTMAPMPAPATEAPAPAGSATTPVPVTPETAVPLPPVHTMLPRPLPSGVMPGGGTSPGGPTLNPSTVPGSPALNARALQARRTATGYVLSGQAEVKDGCQAARFDAAAQPKGPAGFTLVQYRNPANRGVMCTQMVRWVSAAPRTVTTPKPPPFVTVRTAAGIQRVPVR